MSEYQYYEFQTIERPLTKQEMTELRAISSRATITPTRFRNVYNYGDLRADPEKLLEKYFDIFVYEANWGTRQLMLKLPKRLFDLQAASPYCVPDVVSVKTNGDYVILEFRSDDEEAGGWIEEEESEDWLPSLLPLRADLMNGDYRSLYLGWLSEAQVAADEDELELDEDEDEEGDDELDRNQIEPPVPPGLGNLTASLQALVEFLRIDQDLVAVAAERSADLVVPSPAELHQWYSGLPDVEKSTLLVQLLEGDKPLLRAEVMQRFRQSRQARSSEERGSERGRTIGELLTAAAEHEKKRKREEARKKAEEAARRAQAEAKARAKYLASIAGSEEELWLRVESLVEERQAKPYKQAVQLLKDLRDLAAQARSIDAFRVRLNQFRERHVKKLGLIKRLDEAKLADS